MEKGNFNFKFISVKSIIILIIRNFCLVLEQHKRLFSKHTKFRILISDGEEATGYDARTAYSGIVEGILVLKAIFIHTTVESNYMFVLVYCKLRRGGLVVSALDSSLVSAVVLFT